MTTEWSQWIPVITWLDSGWNEPTIPWSKGVYRFRVVQNHPIRGGEVVYIGRGGRHSDAQTSMICSRVGAFIASAMGFWTAHSGGFGHVYGACALNDAILP